MLLSLRVNWLGGGSGGCVRMLLSWNCVIRRGDLIRVDEESVLVARFEVVGGCYRIYRR
jgi:hypothetical protein